MSDELYIDIVSRTLINRLSEEIADSIEDRLSDFIKNLMKRELSGIVSDNMAKETGKIEEAISGLGESTEERIKKSVDEITDIIAPSREEEKNHTLVLQANIDEIKDMLSKRGDEHKEVTEEVKRYINEIVIKPLQSVETGKEEINNKLNELAGILGESIIKQNDMISGVVENKLEAISEKLEGSTSGMNEKLAEIEETSKSSLETEISGIKELLNKRGDEHKEVVEEVKKYINETIIKPMQSVETSKEEIGEKLNELAGILGESIIKQNDMISGVVRKELTAISERLDGSSSDLNEKLTEIEELSKSTLRTEISGIKEMLEKRGDEHSEVIEEVKSYIDENIKKTMQSVDTNREDIGTKLNELTGILGESITKQNDLLSGVVEKELAAISEKLEVSASGIDKQLAEIRDISHSTLNESTEGLKNQIQEVLETLSNVDKGIAPLVEKEMSVQKEFLKAMIAILEDQIPGISESLNTVKASMMDNLRERDKDTIEKVKASVVELREYIGKCFEGSDKKEDELKLVLNNEIVEIKKLITKGKDEREELVKEVLEKSLNDISGKIDISTFRMEEGLKEVEKSAKLTLDRSTIELKRHINELLENRLKMDDSQKSIIKGEIAQIREFIHKKGSEQNETTKGVVEAVLAEFLEKLDQSSSEAERRVSVVEKTAKLLLHRSTADLKKYMEANMKDQIKASLVQTEHLKEELSKLKERHIAEAGEQSKTIRETLDIELGTIKEMLKSTSESSKNISGVIENITKTAISETIGDITTQLRLTMDEVSKNNVFKDELKELKQSLQDRQAEQHEIISSMFFMVKKLSASSNKERELADQASIQLLNALTDVKKDIESNADKQMRNDSRQSEHLKGIIEGQFNGLIEKFTASSESLTRNVANIDKETKSMLSSSLSDFTGKVEEIIARQLTSNDKGVDSLKDLLDRQLPKISEQMERTTVGIVKEVSSAVGKTHSSLNNSIDELKRYFESSNKEMRKLDAEHKGDRDKDISGIREALRESDKRLNDLLNGMYFSIKKLMNAYSNEKDISDRVESKLMNTLDTLYGHLRRLESENDELKMELLRYAGDDMLKNKFEEMEKEIKKTKEMAERNLKEKNEAEEKFRQLQDLWEKRGDMG